MELLTKYEPQHYPSFDPIRFGRRMKAARIMAGYEDVRMFVAQLRREGIFTGDYTVRELADKVDAIEHGLFVPSYPLLVLTAAITAPPGGREFFEEPFAGEVQKQLEMLDRMRP